MRARARACEGDWGAGRRAWIAPAVRRCRGAACQLLGRCTRVTLSGACDRWQARQALVAQAVASVW